MCTETGSKIRLVKAIVHNIYISTCPVLQLLESLFFSLIRNYNFFITYERTQTSLFSEHVHIRDVFIIFYTLLSRHTENGECETAKCCCLSFFSYIYFFFFFPEFLVKHKKPCEHFWCGYIFFPFSLKKFPPLSTFSSLLFSSFD